ncbi:hypothetical protein AC249_AIPGENE6401 [Exaiptasia diaphana]|nr:hypothetical protein AC249_AIPGENE6401 [Exaiptasia diaphana]
MKENIRCDSSLFWNLKVMLIFCKQSADFDGKYCKVSNQKLITCERKEAELEMNSFWLRFRRCEVKDM